MLWKITYEVGKGTVCETLTDIVEAIDLEDAAEIGEEQNCRMKRAMLGDGSFARLVGVEILGGAGREKH